MSSRANHWHDQTVACGQAREADRANFKATAAEAADKNKAEVIAVEHNWQQIAEDKDKEYKDAITSSNASVAAYVDRMRKEHAAAASSKPSTSGVSQATDAPLDTVGTSEATVVPVSDLNICAENTVKAQTWQDFWKSVKDGAEIKTP